MLYKKKPITVEAILWTGENLREIIQFIGYHDLYVKGVFDEYKEDIVRIQGLKIFTLNGPVIACKGDYIIKGIEGEVYPCSGALFHEYYEKVITYKVNESFMEKAARLFCESRDDIKYVNNLTKDEFEEKYKNYNIYFSKMLKTEGITKDHDSWYEINLIHLNSQYKWLSEKDKLCTLAVIKEDGNTFYYFVGSEKAENVSM